MIDPHSDRHLPDSPWTLTGWATTAIFLGLFFMVLVL